MAQGICTPMQLGSFYDAMRIVITQYAGHIHPGDIFIFNDPYAAGGQHLPDIYITMPVFFEDRLVAWSTSIAHHSDVGGIVAGSNALGATEIFQEGLRLPVVKFYERGVPNQALWDVITLNVRTPDKVLGDLQAQMAACTTGERELIELFKRYGATTLLHYADELQNYAERLTRADIREIPDGIYKFTDHIDGLGPDPETVYIRVAITVAGDEVTIDWAGSSPQAEGGINPPFPFTKAATYAGIRSLLGSDIPNCHGFSRPIAVLAPEGSIMNPRFPAPCGARGITEFRMIDCIFGALAEALPDKVTADGNGGSTLPTIAGYQNGKAFIYCETFMGTWGAAASHDGQEGVPHMGANQSNVSIEMVESGYPVRIEQYGMVPDTGGPGRNRGGLALVREYRILCEEAILNIRSDKRKYPPHGLAGGKCGTPSLNLINPGNENRLLPVLMTEVETLKAGDVYRHVMSGGGYGDPLAREPERVLADVLEERVSRGHAADAYSVVITGGGADPVVDAQATEVLRLRKRISGETVEND